MANGLRKFLNHASIFCFLWWLGVLLELTFGNGDPVSACMTSHAVDAPVEVDGVIHLSGRSLNNLFDLILISLIGSSFFILLTLLVKLILLHSV